jgi:hypothetical protein
MDLEHDETYLAGDFFFGDIPMHWFHRAINSPGSGLKVALLIWHYWKLRNRPVCVSLAKCRQIKVKRKARNAALKALEESGLVRVLDYSDRAPVVQVMTAPPRGSCE